MKKLRSILPLLTFLLMVACTSNHKEHSSKEKDKQAYTCPMPQDSVFSDKPGVCPKCGMDLVKTDSLIHAQEAPAAVEYTCPMHPEIIRNKPGACPICGMTLVKKETDSKPVEAPELESLLKPTNEFVVSYIPVTTMQKREEPIEVEALGNIAYDTRQVGNIASRVAGRIEKLYVRYRYQQVSKGQKLFDIYSPELMTAQQNLLFLLKNDAGNASYIEAAKEKLMILGMSEQQVQQLIKTGTPSLTVSVYSQYSGHIHESANGGSMNKEPGTMKDISQLTEELSLKEGMYVQRGKSVFTVYDPSQVWAVLNIYGENQALVKTGNTVKLIPETAPDKAFTASINFIEPFYRRDSKTLTARVYFNNSSLKIPVGSQVRAIVSGNSRNAFWLPAEAVLSLGMDRVVFQKQGAGFRVHKITVGMAHKGLIQVLGGISSKDSVAANAQYLMDSESFIKVKN